MKFFPIHSRRVRVATILFSTFLAISASAFLAPRRESLPNFDKRAKANRKQVAEKKRESLKELRALLPKARVDFDEHTGAPSWIIVEDKFLSGPKGKGRGITAATAADFPENEPHRATKAFLKEHQKLFGFGPEILADAKVKREFVTKHNGFKTVVWEQELDGIPVFQGLLVSHTTKNDELVNLSSHFIPNAAQAAQAGTPNRAQLQKNPKITAQHAVALAAQNLGENLAAQNVSETDAAFGAEKRQHFRAKPLNGVADARLVWLPMDSKAMVLCWEVTLTSRARGETYRVLIDAQTGEALVRHCLTQYISPATFNVFTSDSPSPFSPGSSTPSSFQPPLVSRTLVTWGALDTNASPNGWINDGVNETIGNNVDAHLDRNDDDLPDLPRPQGSPFRTFNFPVDLSQPPSTYPNAAVTELFYWCNWTHDKLYQLGFTEAAGNFQTSNFGRGGFGNDAVLADAQDGGAFNNANMTTSSDGIPARIQMYLFDGPTPDRDGDFDHEVVIHEYVHGLSTRLVGGGGGLDALQSEGMGEGWSDWYALTLLSEPGDDVNAVFAKGGYATYLLGGMTQNYYFGIRRYPYSTDMTKNPLTFKDISPTQASSHSGIPRSSIVGTKADEAHNMGEVWCVTLWEVRARLIAKHGYAIGNQMVLQLVTDGMNLTPANPNFLQARDGILQADIIDNGGSNLGELWAAFAKRGMGYSAISPVSSTTVGLVEAYDIPDDLSVTPADGLTSNGPDGGPFSPASKNFTLVNINTNTVNWTAGSSVSWLTLSQTSGVLAPAATNSVIVTINAAANVLASGIYNGTVRFTNITSGVTQSRTFVLRVGQPDYFTELFDSGDNDLDFQTLTFTPNGSANFYSACREPASVFPTDPSGGTTLALISHSFLTLNLATNISIYGHSTNRIFLSSSGQVTLNAGDSSSQSSLASFFSLPRVSASLAHLHPDESGGIVSWLQLSNRVAITFQNVIEFGTGALNNFQIELFYDGRIRMTHLAISSTGGLVGLSAGNGIPAGFTESDLSNYGPCALPLAVTVPAQAMEGDGTLSGQGQINIFSPLATDVVVSLDSSDISELTVPSSVTITAGQTTANFDLTIQDDSDLDGVKTVIISATSPGFLTGTDTIQVGDNESAVLTLNTPLTITEGVSPQPASVNSSAAPSDDVVVNLSSSNPTQIQVPPSVILPAGQTSAVFNITAIDDDKIEAEQSISLNAHVSGWTDAAASVVLKDNEPTNILVTLPAAAREGDGLLAGAGKVQISGTLPANLLITLLSSDTSELTVPPAAIIPAGQTNTTFNLTIVDEGEVDGPQTASVTANASGFSSGNASMTINDNESPPLPSTPSPAHLATDVNQTADLSWQSSAMIGEVITNDVYFGTNPTPGTNEFLGSTTGTTWDLPNLLPLTTYYWQIVARKTASVPGPVWQFTTHGVDHFVWNPISSPQFVNAPFSATVTAKDVFETTVSNFTGTARLSGTVSGLGGTGIVITEIGPNTPDFVEFMNVSAVPIDISQWQITVYDADTYPLPLTTFIVPSGASVEPGEIFRLNEYGTYPGVLPEFFTGTNIDWTSTAPSAVLVRNNSGNVIDFVCAGAAVSTNITSPITIPVSQWQGPAIPSTRVTSETYQRIGNEDQNSNADWVAALSTPGITNVGLITPFAGTETAFQIAPTNTGAFVDGAWTGNISVFAPTANLVLRADDGEDHTGSSNPFEVKLRNDISVSITDSPDPVSIGGNVTYVITVTNIGPASADAVTVSNVLPATASLVSVTPSQGTFSVDGKTVLCNLQNINGTNSATVTIVATATNMGVLTNRVFVPLISVTRVDPYLANNSASVTTEVRVPSVSLGDASVFEGNSGLVDALFSVSVSPAPAVSVSVNFATSNGSAFSPADFVSTNGTLVFAPGETNKTIAVKVKGDVFYEPDETFTLNLSGATNATLTNSQGTGTIRNDDAIPTLSVTDVFMNEGNSGSNSAIFSVSLSAASALDVSFNYTTISGNATSGIDYIAKSGALTIPAGQTNVDISVAVNGDLSIEPDEVFYVDLSSAANATLLKREGVGLIINDDGLPGDLDHFVWSAIAPVQYVGQPFNVTLSAQDVFNRPATNFSGPATLTALGGTSATTNTILPSPVHTQSASGNFTLGYSFTPTNTLTVTQVRSYFGTKVSIWTDSGTLLVSQPVNAPAGAWHATPLAVPVTLNAGTTYRVGVYIGGGAYYWRTDGSNSFPNGIINQGYDSSGDSYPNTTDTVRWWLVDLRYTVGSGGSIPITPTVSGTFVNGEWTGDVTGLLPATNVVLRASDNNGHTGDSSSFDLILQNDIALSMTASPDPVPMGDNITYLLTVTNIGPNAANGVIVSNVLPASVSTVSVTPSQGTSVTNGSLVTCNLGTLPANASATISIVARTSFSPGSITNSATVYRAEADALLSNNSAAITTSVESQSLSISNASVLEGDAGSTQMQFAVSLFPPSSTNVTVNFATANGSAESGNDYAATNGILIFAPGETNQNISVQVFGDDSIEVNETFSVVLSNPVNASIATTQATGTILNDENTGIVAYFSDNDVLATGWSGPITNAGFIPLHIPDISTFALTNLDILVINEIGGVSSELLARLPSIQNWVMTGGKLVVHDWNIGNANPNPLLLGTSGITSVRMTTSDLDVIPPATNRVVAGPKGTLNNTSLDGGTFSADGYVPGNQLPPGSEPIIGIGGNPSNVVCFSYPLGSGLIYYSGIPLDCYLEGGNCTSSSPAAAMKNIYAPNVLVYASGQLNGGNFRPTILTQPTNQTIAVGGTAQFTVAAVGSQPLSYQWLKNNLAINSETNASLVIPNAQNDDAGNYSVIVSNAHGMATSLTATLTVIDLSSDSNFRIVALTTNNSKVVDHNAITGDDRGGIAASTSHVFYTGDSSTGRFALSDLSGGTALGKIFNALCCDLRSGAVYSLANGTNLVSAGGTVTSLLEHDGTTGQLNGSAISLSTPITLPTSNVGIFSGYGRIVLHTGSHVYDIALPSGVVVDLGPMSALSHASTENWAYWGVAEFFNDTISLVYVRNLQSIVRTTAPGNVTTNLATFSNLGDMAAITVSVLNGRWYFHHEGNSQFGGTSETIGYADAVFEITPIGNAPEILTQPASQSTALGGFADFNVTVSGTAPLSYQWRKEGFPISGETNAAYLITNVIPSDAGNYDVVVTNSFGSVTSVVAALTVSSNDAVVIDFDEFAAPCYFMETTGLTNRYAGLGVIFAGPGALDGGAVLDQCSMFGVNGYSAPNYLAFNNSVTFTNGGMAQGPESLVFPNLISSLHLRIGSSQPGIGTLLAYDTNNQVVASNSVPFSMTLQTLGVAAPNIARAVLSSSSASFVIDDVTFVPLVPPVPPTLRFRSVEMDNGLLRMIIGAEDDSPMTMQRASNVSIYSATNLTPPVIWEPLNFVPLLSNGVMEINESLLTNGPTRFFRATISP